MSISIFVEKLCRHVRFLEPPPQLVPSLREDNGNDHAIEAEGLTEDENEDHADEDFLLLSVGADTSVTDDTDSESSCKGRETASQAWGQVSVARAEIVSNCIRLNFSIENDGNNEAVDT